MGCTVLSGRIQTWYKLCELNSSKMGSPPIFFDFFLVHTIVNLLQMAGVSGTKCEFPLGSVRVGQCK